MVSGGCKQRKGNNYSSADWHAMVGARKRLGELGIDERDRIETFLPGDDDNEIVKFRAGKIINVPDATPQARRFEMISGIDVLVAVAGDHGTRQNLDLALALKRPALPLPMFTKADGKPSASRAFWTAYEDKIRSWFNISDEVAHMWEGLDAAKLDKAGLDELARDVAHRLVSRLVRTCMVIMPFAKDFDALYDRLIQPAIEAAGFQPIRTDRLHRLGDKHQPIRQGIETCDCALAVLTGMRSNVLYEVGFAHGKSKPVILLIEGQDVGTPDIPFDIDSELLLEYRGVEESLKDSIRKMLENVPRT